MFLLNNFKIISNMNINTIKNEMIKFRDFYGGDLLYVDEVKNANTKEELEKIIELHRDHMESMLCDANSHLNNFKRKLGLGYDNYK